jgi:hypothetical protein
VLSELGERADLWLGDLDALPFERSKITKLPRVAERRRRRLVT